MKYQSGKIALHGDLATVNLPKDLRYLDPQQAQIVLEKLWSNPSGEGTLGMILPANASPISEALDNRKIPQTPLNQLSVTSDQRSGVC